MIYNKDVVFPYPVLTNSNNGYKKSLFDFDVVNLYDNREEYTFEISYIIGSDFIKELISINKAVLVFIVSSQDSYFTKLEVNQKKVTIPKNKISFNTRTTIQLHIQSIEEIDMSSCEDLKPFYDKYKTHLKLPKHVLLGYSNLVKYYGSDYNSINLFSKAIDTNYKDSFGIEINEESIVLKFDSDNHLIGYNMDKNFINLYIYIGLSRAITKFINNNIENEEFVDLASINEEDMTILDSKLYRLMYNKGITEIDFESIDNIISKISNNIVGRYTSSLEGVISNEG